jgi:plastocyanin
VLLSVLTTDAKIGLALTAAVFAGFSLIVALIVPRTRPDFPGKRLPAFLVVCGLLFVAMMSAVLIFGAKTKAETAAEREKIAVGETDYAIEVPKTTVSPGIYTLEVTNYGQIPHNLTVQGPGGKKKATATIKPGESASLVIELRKGDYLFFSSLPGQQQQGVSESVTVS